MLRLGQERDELRVVADQWGGPTHAADIAKLLIIVTKARLDGTLMPGIYHYSAAPLCTWFDFANAIFSQARSKGLRTPHVIPITSQEYPVAAERPANSALDCNKLTSALNIALPDWHAGIQSLLNSDSL
jgi:dTDP-4-dehydrorhamnose reductase